MGEQNVNIGGVLYVSDLTQSRALHDISHPPQDRADGQPMYYRYPQYKMHHVVVYVMEKTMDKIDIPKKHTNRISTITFEGFEPEKQVNGHGAIVLDLLAGATYGAAKWCQVVAVGRPTDDLYGTANWGRSFKAVTKHFSDLKARDPHRPLHGVMNMSLGIKNQSDTRNALLGAINAGIIVVGAAGNEAASLDDPAGCDAYLPEAIKDKVIIIGSLNDLSQKSKESNHGNRVDYWVLGDNLRHKRTPEPPTEARGPGKSEGVGSGTSYATPIATGIISRMLAAGQVPSGTVEDVRAKLDEWAYRDRSNLKHLRNAPGLN